MSTEFLDRWDFDWCHWEIHILRAFMKPLESLLWSISTLYLDLPTSTLNFVISKRMVTCSPGLDSGVFKCHLPQRWVFFLDDSTALLVLRPHWLNQLSGMMTCHYLLSCNYLARMEKMMTFPMAHQHNLTLCPCFSLFIHAVSQMYRGVTISVSYFMHPFTLLSHG